MAQNILRILLLLYTLVIIVLHVIPTGSTGALNQSDVFSVRTDYLLHTVLFLPWIVLARFYVYRSPDRLTYRIILWITLGLFLAVGSEAIQYWLPYRSFNIIDLYFNLLGIASGGLLFLWGRNSEIRIRRAEIYKQHPAD